MNPSAHLASVKGLYVITQVEPDLGRGRLDVCRAALGAGVKVIQLREKLKPAEELEETAAEMAEMCRRERACFIVNDHLELAKGCGADGFHSGFAPERLVEFRSSLGSEAIIGMSVDTLAEALQAQEMGADYASLGPIFGTQTKPGLPPPCGVSRIAEVKAKLEMPLVAIGGITEANIAEVAAAGADAAAVITAVTRADNMEQACRRLIQLFAEGAGA